MNPYEERKQARIDYYNDKAAGARHESNRLFKESDKMLSAIPFGQPILVGHHSETGDRNYRNRAYSKMANSVAESDKADYYAQKAEAAENNNAISSDDPDAIEKLKDKLAALTNTQEEMKKANAYYRKHSTMKGYADISDDRAAEMDEKIKNGYSWNQQPYASYLLQNNNQNMSRIKKRIEALERNSNISDEDGWEFDGGRVEMNTEYNRIQIFFDGKPDEEIRCELKGHGFRWAPSVKAWQRQINGNGLFALKQLKCVQPKTA